MVKARTRLRLDDLGAWRSALRPHKSPRQAHQAGKRHVVPNQRTKGLVLDDLIFHLQELINIPVAAQVTPFAQSANFPSPQTMRNPVGVLSCTEEIQFL
jgi:hypothetical protein